MTRLRDMGRMPPPDSQLTPIYIHPDTQHALIRLLFSDEWRGVGYSEFLNRAIARAEEEREDKD